MVQRRKPNINDCGGNRRIAAKPPHVARRDRLHLQIAMGIARIPDAHMAERVEHAAVSQDVVGGHRIHPALPAIQFQLQLDSN
jgi:hypothetical protein